MEKNTKKSVMAGALLVLVFILFVILIQFQCYINYSRSLDQYFSVCYNTTIAPEGERNIESILENVSKLQTDKEKLEAIAEWEVTNFTELFWERHKDPNFNLTYLDPPINRYGYDQHGKIRAMHSQFLANEFANDPCWIAYFKMGACGELAYLYENVANRSGFKTQLVRANLRGNFFGMDYIANNHAWVEIKLDDEWWYFDPDVYGQYHNLNFTNYENKWFNKTEYYNIFTPDQILEVYVINSHEDIGKRYPKLVYTTPEILISKKEKISMINYNITRLIECFNSG